VNKRLQLLVAGYSLQNVGLQWFLAE